MEWDKHMDDKQKTSPRPNPATHGPSLALLVKLGSIAVHADEMLSPMGHGYDRVALQQLLKDSEVQFFIKDMGAIGLLPVKRNK